MTQRDRVLRVLRQRGAHGLTQVDFLREPTIDGGAPITRVAARIEELKEAGHAITTRGWRDKCAVYVLGAATGSPAGATDGPWRRVYMCKDCGYVETASATCQHGHDATLGWSVDLRPAVATTSHDEQLPEAA